MPTSKWATGLLLWVPVVVWDISLVSNPSLSTIDHSHLYLTSVQYARANGASVIAVDTGNDKREYLKSVGAKEFVDFKLVPDTIEEVRRITNGGAHAVIVAAGNAKAFAHGCRNASYWWYT